MYLNIKNVFFNFSMFQHVNSFKKKNKHLIYIDETFITYLFVLRFSILFYSFSFITFQYKIKMEKKCIGNSSPQPKRLKIENENKPRDLEWKYIKRNNLDLSLVVLFDKVESR